MSDHTTGEPSIAAKVADSVTDAKQLAGKVRSGFENAELPKTIINFASDATRAAPLTMLVMAFIAGAIFNRRRGF